MNGISLVLARSKRASCVLVVLLLTGCSFLPNDEAAWVLKDLAAGEGDSQLKEITPNPVRRKIDYAVQGQSYQGDLYHPAHPPLAALVLVPGVAEQGKDDPRLIAFATTLARARYLVLIPDLPNLRALAVQAEDAQGVAHAFVHLMSRPEFPHGGRAGIAALSYAVGPAVLAALDPVIRERVSFILGIGGYYDLQAVVTFFTTGYFQKEGKWHYLAPDPYGKWVFVLSNFDRLSDPHDRHTLRTMVWRKLDDPQARIDDLRSQLTTEGRAVMNLLDNREPARTPALLARLPVTIRTVLEALNLARHDLSKLRAQLILLHGVEDNIIPYTESLALAAAAPAGQSKVFIIDGLSHVDVNPLGLDRQTAWRAIWAILAQRKKTQEGTP